MPSCFFRRLTESSSMTNSQTHSLSNELYLALLRQAHVGAVAAAALHEYNNLATPILMRAQDALSRNDPAALQQTAESVQRNLHKGLELCRHLMSLLATPLEGVESVSLSEIVTNALAAMGRPLEKDRIEVQREIPEQLRINVNRLLFEQLLIHLLMEMKSVTMGRGARVSIKAGMEGASAILRLECNGQRCTPDFVAREWIPWLDTARPLPPLIGSPGELPLRACRSIATAHNVEISVLPMEPTGCTVSLRLT